VKVLCYVDGEAGEGEEFYDTTPGDAARMFAEDGGAEEIDGPVNIVTEPLDEAAGALPGWTTRADGARVKLFRVSVRWVSEDVHGFDVGRKAEGEKL